MQIIFFGLCLRFILSIINIYYYPLPGSDFDAVAFHGEAILFSNYISSLLNGLQYSYEYRWAYSVFLGIIYFIFGESLILASLLSCVSWGISALIFNKILIKLKFTENSIIYSLIFYSFLFPITTVYSTFILREAYMLLFFNMICLSVINLDLKKELKNKCKNLFLLMISCILLAVFHVSNIYILVLLFSVFIFWFLYKNLGKKLQKIYFFMFCILSLIIFNYFGYYEKIYLTIKNYQMGHFVLGMDYRAQYTRLNDPMIQNEYNFFRLISNTFHNIYNYFMQPSFYKASNLLDFTALYENTMRVLIIFVSLFKLFSKFDKKNLFIFIFVIWFLSEVVYAQGTVNWGTASRHHMPGFGLMIILLFFPLRKKFN